MGFDNEVNIGNTDTDGSMLIVNLSSNRYSAEAEKPNTVYFTEYNCVYKSIVPLSALDCENTS
jgi:hypothetical protein